MKRYEEAEGIVKKKARSFQKDEWLRYLEYAPNEGSHLLNKVGKIKNIP